MTTATMTQAQRDETRQAIVRERIRLRKAGVFTSETIEDAWETDQFNRAGIRVTSDVTDVLRAGNFPELYRPFCPEVEGVECIASRVLGRFENGSRECEYTFANGVQICTDHTACKIYADAASDDRLALHRFPMAWVHNKINPDIY